MSVGILVQRADKKLRANGRLMRALNQGYRAALAKIGIVAESILFFNYPHRPDTDDSHFGCIAIFCQGASISPSEDQVKQAIVNYVTTESPIRVNLVLSDLDVSFYENESQEETH